MTPAIFEVVLLENGEHNLKNRVPAAATIRAGGTSRNEENAKRRERKEWGRGYDMKKNIEMRLGYTPTQQHPVEKSGQARPAMDTRHKQS